MKKTLLALLCTGSAAAFAQEAGVPGWKADFGADVRLRYEYYNRTPDLGPRDYYSGREGYGRFRTRVWGVATAGRLTGYLRIGNEFRYYFFPEDRKGDRRWPDVTFIDNLYIEAKELWDSLDVKVGRQDITDLGAGRIINEGTPSEGSRSVFFDAVRLTFNFEGERKLDVIGLMVSPEDWMPTLGHRHGGRGPDSKGYDYEYSGSNQREFGLMAYWQDRSDKALGWDAYYVWKAEHAANQEGSWLLSLEDGNPRSYHTHTLGGRLLPQFTENLRGEAEAALQVGDDNLFAAMGYAGLTYSFGDVPWRPEVTAAVLGLTGSSEGARGNHAWHALFNRGTWMGDLPSDMYPGFDYANLIYPHLALTASPAEGHTLIAQAGPMFAPVTESDEGGRAGHFRGAYAQALWIVELGRAVSPALAGTEFVFLGEVFRMGDYFNAVGSREGSARVPSRPEGNTGAYLCWELRCRF